jgi:aminoglycoside/choline kinase family phosphotransferase
MSQSLKALYRRTFGQEPSIEPLSAAGSNRRYYRLTAPDGQTLIGVEGTNKEENRAFVEIARCFESHQLPTPRVLAVDDANLVYIQEDLGNLSLFDAIGQGRKRGGDYNDEEEQLLHATIRQLPRLQFEGVKGLDTSVLFPSERMDEQSCMFDLNYFKYMFLKLVGVEFNELKLQVDFDRLAESLANTQPQAFLYRDFQARNVMVKEGIPYFIDFQGGRLGPIYYDVASFLWQASARYSDTLRQELIISYKEALQPYATIDDSTFTSKLMEFVMFRMLQVLGAYGYRGLWEKKTYFIRNIPSALSTLSQLVNDGWCDHYPYLKAVVGDIVQSTEVTRIMRECERTATIDSDLHRQSLGHHVAELLEQDANYTKADKEPLVVDVMSFSFKKGLPEDPSGNGGGYVFDCRSTHNPGRYQEYKQLTGLDQPVIDFLEQDGELLVFLKSVYRLADFHVERFMERGFTHLMFSFGCTGGQHRSVYSAQHLAEHLHRKYGIEVRIKHREQHISQVLKAQ